MWVLKMRKEKGVLNEKRVKFGIGEVDLLWRNKEREVILK